LQGGRGADKGQTIAILANGSVWAWGDNQKGQLGDGTRMNSDVPVPVSVPAGAAFVKINSGGYSCCAIDRSGRLWSWGGNDNGQLGTRTSAVIETMPVDVGMHLTQVSSTASNVAGFKQG
jgi:alpha-tubulin suppressor-like RCC1 family protein